MNASQYLKNVGKSLGYIAVDSFKQMNPNIAAVYDNAKEFTSDLYQTIDDFKAKAVGSDQTSFKSKAKSTANEVWKNARDDFLSGKWYNKERKEAADNEMLKEMGFDFDFDFDLDDFGDTETPSSKSDKVELEQSQRETEAIIGTVNGSVASAANTIASANMKSTEYLASIQNTNAAALYDLNANGFNSVNAGLAAINANMAAMVTLAKPLTDHMQNSAVFYAKSTEFQNKALSLLEQIAKNTGTPEKKSGKRKNSFEDYVGENGIDLARLFSDMKGGASETIKGYKELLSMMGGGAGLMGDFRSSPISALLTSLLIPAMIPGTTKKKMKGINDYIGTLGFTELNKISKKVNDSPFGLILDLLGVNIPTLDLKKTVNTGKYNKGRTVWTGKSEKALQEVIPYYLSKMTAVLDGTGEMEIFDYERGKFTTKAQIKQAYDKENKARASSASYALASRVKSSGTEGISRDDINDFSSLLILEGGSDTYLLFSSNKKDRDDYLKNHASIRDYLDKHPKLKKTLVDYASSAAPVGRNVNKYDMGRYVQSIGEAQLSTSKAHSRYEETGEFDLLFNNSRDLRKGGGIIGGVDKSGYSALDYLRGIYINTSGGAGRGSSGYYSGGKGIPDYLPGISLQSAQNAAQKAASTTAATLSTSTDDILKALEQEYGEYWKDISKDDMLKDYVIEKERAKREGDEDSFIEDSTLEAKLKTGKITGKLKKAATNFAKSTGLTENIADFVSKMGSLATKPTEMINKALDLVHSTLHDIIFSKAGLFGWLFDKENGKITPALKKVGERFKSLFFGVPTGANSSDVDLAEAANDIQSTVSSATTFTTTDHFSASGSGLSAGASGQKRSGGLVGSAGNVLKEGFTDFGQLLYQLFSRTIGANGDEKSEKKERKFVADIIGNATNAIKDHAGDALLGGMIGGGVSLLTGGVISPLFGASLGAATGLLLSSNQLKDFLFGNEKEGKQGKVFKESGAKIRRFIEDQLPSSLLGGGIGAVGGALMGHPVAGMFLGAGIGFISKSKGMQSFLFGETDKDGNQTRKGLISKNLQDRFKKALPGMSAGAITGLVASAFGGPFGLVGNMLIGAGVGGIVTSEKFKNWFFGEKDEKGKRTGGFVQELRDRLIDPTKEMFLNLGDRIRQDFRNAALGFFDKLRSISGIVASSTILRNIKNVGGEGAKWINGKLEKLGLPGLPTKLIPDLRGASAYIKSGNIRGGYLTYDKSGRALTAAERLKAVNNLGLSSRRVGKVKNSFGYKMSDMIAGMSEDEISGMSTDIADILGAKTDEARASALSGNALLSKFIEDNGSLSNAQLRKIRDSLKVEGKAKPVPVLLDIMKKDLTETKDIIKDIWENGIKIFSAESASSLSESEKSSVGSALYKGDQTSGESAKSTVKGQIEAKAKETADSIREREVTAEEKQADIQEKQYNALVGEDSEIKNDKETKKGGLLNKFFGKESAIGKAASWIVKAGTVVGGIFLALAASGKLDKIFNKLGIGFGDGENSFIGTVGNTVSNIFGNKDGKEAVTDSSTTDSASLSDKVWTMLPKQITAILPALARQAREVIVKQLDDFARIMAKLPILQRFFATYGDDFARFMAKILDKFDNVLISAGSGTIKEVLEDATVVITVVSVIVDFTAGMQDAETIMKVKNPSVPERIFCGLLRALVRDIPVVGIFTGLIPESFYFDVGMATIGKAMGLEDLQRRREEAQAELDEFNKSTGKNLDWSQYAKQKLGAKTFIESGWDTIKSGALRTGNAIGNIVKYTKESGSVAGGLKKYLTTAWAIANGNTDSKANGQYTNLGGELFAQALPGITGEFINVISRIYTAGLHGDFKAVWSENFDKLKENPATNIITNVLNLPMVGAKVFSSLVAGVVNIGNGITDATSGISKGFDYLSEEADAAKKAIHSTTEGFGNLSYLLKAREPAENVPLKPLFKSLAYVTRVAMIPIEGIKQVGRIASVVLSPIIDDFKTAIENTSTDVKEVAGLAFTGHPFKLFNIKSTVSSSNPVVKGLSEAVLDISKYVMSTPAMAIGIFNEAKDAVSTFINNTKTVFEGVKTDSENIKNLAFSGNFVDLLAYESAGATTGELGFDFTAGFISGLQKILFSGIAVTGWVGQKIYGFIQPKIDAIRECVDFYKGEINDTVDKIENGDVNSLKDLLGDSPLKNPDNPGELFFNASVKIARLVALPVAAVKATGGLIGSYLNRVMVAVRANSTIHTASLDTLKEYVDDDEKTVEDIIAFEAPFDTHDPTSGFRSNVFGISKLFYGMIKMVSSIGTGIKDKIGDAWNKYKQFVNFGYVDDESGSGSGIGGGASGFISQVDPRYAKKNLGAYNVGSMGCGPAAASMVLGNSMNSNINLARKYQTSGGTDLAYFAEAFSRSGRRPIYYNLGGGASGTDMVRDIASGRPVVLMGRDPYNTSKRFSPFGPNNHYVVARGFKNGGVVIDDPESSTGGRIYSTSILRNVKAAVSAGSSGIGRFGIGGGGAMIGEISQQCWAFFKSKGYSDGAAAGVLANIQAESSFRTGADNPGDAAGGSHGLCQWNGSRWTALKNLAKSMGKSEFDLDVQLEHLHSEIGQAGAGYTSIEDPATAAEQFCRKFERPKYPDKDSAIRRPIAIEFYNAYSGKNYSYTADSSSNSSSSLSALSTGIGATSTTQETKASKFFNLVSTIGSAFGKAITGKIGNGVSNLLGGSNNTNSNYSVSTSGSEISNGNIPVSSWPGKQPIQYLEDLLGKVEYNNKTSGSPNRQDLEKGYGDCSSTVSWALTKAGLPVTSDSRWQYRNQDGTDPSWQRRVWYDNGNPLGNRTLPKLEPNDVVFWGGGDKSYPDAVSHVEMVYDSNGTLIGTGTPGPGRKNTRKRDMKSITGKTAMSNIIKVVRPQGPWDSASGSGLDLSDLRVTGRRENTVTRNGKVYSFSEYKRAKSSAGASGMSDLNISKDTAILLRTIITLIEALVKNTNDVSLIYKLLEMNLGKGGVDKESAEAISKLVDDKNADASKIEDSLSSLKATVDAILAS